MIAPRLPLVCAAVLAAVSAALTGCTSGSGSTVPTRDVTTTATVTETRSPSSSYVPRPATSVAPLSPGAAPAKGEVDRPCPYIASSQDDGPGSLADLEGDRVYRTTVLTTMDPVGCRFYFWSEPYEAIAEIATQRFRSAQAAHDAMILTARVDPRAEGYPNFLPGIDAISYRTTFFGPDGSTDWACVFAKGALMVTVRTQRSDTSYNARLIAKAIAARI